MKVIKRIVFLSLAFVLLCMPVGCGSKTSQEAEPETKSETGTEVTSRSEVVRYYFRNEKLLDQHYEKHGIEMGFDSPESYEAAASDVINNPDALSKEEAEDGDLVFYIEDTNDFVVLSTDNYIRTYFKPDAGKAYYDRQ